MATKRITEQRQAVVLIHGMGEQHPLDTIRAFLRGTHPPGARFFSWPQRLGGNTANCGGFPVDIRKPSSRPTISSSTGRTTCRPAARGMPSSGR
ncbi:hypothetical protein [Corynebacterium efficiens YS-314]|uniref:Uncharacterized protein n=1 Tax=Corynebacterium efficiens (strain DSM 44549 / YS-314 / AJ 12310 / JCM 11189 / NBRC 100395) TaxID=196164 RepID=Q8FTG9_COREF|nr:hypothetical protein [Corynebacterium efficiens YS-314]